MINEVSTRSWTSEPFIEYLTDGRFFVGWVEKNYSLSEGNDNLNFLVYTDGNNPSYTVNNVPNPYYRYDQSYLWGTVSQEDPSWGIYDNDIFVTYASKYNGGAINTFVNSVTVHTDTLSVSEAVRYFDYDPYFQTPKDIWVDHDTVYLLFSSPHDTHYSYQGGAEVRLGSLNSDLVISEHSIELSDDWSGSHRMTMSVGSTEKNIFWLTNDKIYGSSITENGSIFEHEDVTDGYSSELVLFDAITTDKNVTLVGMRKGNGQEILKIYDPTLGFAPHDIELPTGPKARELKFVDLGDDVVRLYWTEGYDFAGFGLKFADFNTNSHHVSIAQNVPGAHLEEAYFYGAMANDNVEIFDVSEPQNGKILVASSASDGINITYHYLSEVKNDVRLITQHSKGYSLDLEYETDILDIFGHDTNLASYVGDYSLVVEVYEVEDVVLELSSHSSVSENISSADALDALKLSVGLTPSNGTPNAYDYIAADFNRDGKVTSSDALDILKYAVGLEVERDAEWVFIRSDEDLTAVGKNNVAYDTNILIEDISSDAEIGLVGILIGDVNDSYSGLIA